MFRDHRLLRAVIDAALEEHAGRILTLGVLPELAAVLTYGCYCVPGGDARSDQARDLLADVHGPCEIVLPTDDAWCDLVEEVHGHHSIDRSMRSYLPGPDLAGRTAAGARDIPAGYTLVRMDEALAGQAGTDTAPHGVEVMGGPAAFVAKGYGWGLVQDGRLACAATSYAVGGGAVELAIATHPDHRQRGLAACAASAFVQESLVREIVPHWNASNPVSQRLAERLGFRFVGMVGIRELTAETGMQPDSA
jgi:hypothetical protein